MKHRLMCLVAPLVLLSAQGAFAQARYQQIYENSVKPGQELVYENYVKKLVAAADGYTFRRVEQVGAMSDFDRPTGVQMLQKFFAARWAAMLAELNKMTTFRQEFISTRRADLSRIAPPTTSSR